MINLSHVSMIIRNNLTLNEGYIEFIEQFQSMLKEPLLYIRVADKRLILESIREMIHQTDSIIRNFGNWNKNQ
jgi:hypothetical protein